MGFRVVPRDDDSLVRHLDVWADPGSGLPLRVSMATRTGSTPVVVSRFLEVRQHKPDDDVLRPPAPARASISATTEPDLSPPQSRVNLPLPPRRAGGSDGDWASALSGWPRMDGWSSFVVMGARAVRSALSKPQVRGGPAVEVAEVGDATTGSLNGRGCALTAVHGATPTCWRVRSPRNCSRCSPRPAWCHGERPMISHAGAHQ